MAWSYWGPKASSSLQLLFLYGHFCDPISVGLGGAKYLVLQPSIKSLLILKKQQTTISVRMGILYSISRMGESHGLDWSAPDTIDAHGNLQRSVPLTACNLNIQAAMSGTGDGGRCK